MNNEIKYSVELSTIEILNLKFACSFVKEICPSLTDWNILIDKLNSELDICGVK